MIDPASAKKPSLAASIRASRLIYFPGSFPRFLGETLANSTCWDAALDAYKEGAVIAGSSAGAMVLCKHYYDPYEKKVLHGLNPIPNSCILPHHNTLGRSWARELLQDLPNNTLIGVDEQTGMVNDWNGYGISMAQERSRSTTTAGSLSLRMEKPCAWKRRTSTSRRSRKY